MNEIQVKLSLLYDILVQKHDFLKQILTICENTENVMAFPSKDRAEILRQMAFSKQELIENVLNCDEVFRKTFDSIHIKVEKESTVYKQEISKLQQMIKNVMALDIEIRIKETETKDTITSQSRFFAASSKALPNSLQSQARLLDKYKKNSKLNK